MPSGGITDLLKQPVENAIAVSRRIIRMQDLLFIYC